MTAVSIADGLLRIGKQSIPFIAGEIQFWRMAPETWEPAIRAAKNSGVTIISTYLSWRRHEPVRGELSFSGETDQRLDVVRFLRICADAGVFVQLKPGPWICAEEPGGGYPDWLLEDADLLAKDDEGHAVLGYNPPFQHPVPSYSDERYLSIVREWFRAVWEAVGDQIYPRGPVIALQLDNEPSVCFQDSLYGADYADSAVGAFRRWLAGRYHDADGLRHAWKTTDTIETALPPRRPASARSAEPLMKLRDWTDFKTWATGEYLAALRRMHEEFGGSELLFTVNLVTHPVHDVPVSHAAIRDATGAAVGEDHYYIPPLDADDIHRLARSAATARAAGEPLPWVPELQAGIWRSPGEVIEYPDPTPVEQEVWWGAAVALGFAGFNLYMLANRENWEYAPLTESGRSSAFFAPIDRFTATAAELPAALTLDPEVAVVVAWHREDAYAAYSVTGTSRIPGVPWHSEDLTVAYEGWERTLKNLTSAGLVYDLWDTMAPFPDLPLDVPLVISHRSGVSRDLVDAIAATGRTVVLDDGRPTQDAWAAVHARVAHVLVDEKPAPDTLVALRRDDKGLIVHVVHWGDGTADAVLILPTAADGILESIDGEQIAQVNGGRARISLATGHRIHLLRSATPRRAPQVATS